MGKRPPLTFFPNPTLAKTYFFYSALLVLKLLALVPLARFIDNPERARKANLNDLKNLTPFWLLGGLYMTTGPDPMVARYLLRAFVIARFMVALAYVRELPRIVPESANAVSYAIAGFMGAWVINHYHQCI